MKTIYISIGNSDDKLSQVQWSEFVKDLDDISQVQWSEFVKDLDDISQVQWSEFVKDLDDICSAFKRHGAWSSQSWSPYQNACICIEVPNAQVRELRNSLRGLAVQYRQDSIAMATAETELVTP